MPVPAEIRRSLYGCWRLFLGDKAGLQAFDLSEEGFFRSFWVVMMIAPIYAASVVTERGLLAADRGFAAEDLSDGRFFIARALTLFIDWFTFPVIMVFVARQLKFGRRYAPFITVRNWTALPAAALTSLPTLLYGIGLIPLVASTFATFIFLVVILRYGWFVAKTVLHTNSTVAAGLVALDLVVSLLIGRLGDLIAGI